MRKVIAMLSVLFCLVTGVESVHAKDNCGVYYAYYVSSPRCASQKCGLWDKTRLYQRFYYERTCVKKDNTTYTQRYSTSKTLDCDC